MTNKKQMLPKIPRFKEIGQLKKATGKRRRTLGNRAAMLALSLEEQHNKPFSLSWRVNRK